MSAHCLTSCFIIRWLLRTSLLELFFLWTVSSNYFAWTAFLELFKLPFRTAPSNSSAMHPNYVHVAPPSPSNGVLNDAFSYFSPLNSSQLLSRPPPFRHPSRSTLFSRFSPLVLPPVHPPANLQPYHWVNDASTTHPVSGWINTRSARRRSSDADVWETTCRKWT